MNESSKTEAKWPWEGKAAAIVFGLGMLLWPILSFGAIFVLDEPPKDSGDELRKALLVWSTWAYPLFYLGGFLVYRRFRAWDFSRLSSFSAWVITFVVPAYYLWFWLYDLFHLYD